MTDMEMAILDFEREWWRHAGAKDREVSQRWGINASEYDRLLAAVAERPEAMAYDPLTVRRIRRRLVPPSRTRFGSS
ncbi:DUF3263 domain-containing protein [Pedococcus bigeumensis]|uniref:DUF3263 domain-containing protein n=1 Tax=Pedococcus bigeumensis TaxID=433644 RepID=A0A502CIF1_9MICO|nr:DUF3263 domain-containing protein [Pedococcus bigeumensis]TPG12502.1 DUF3263 domain-containing protein [Pedococcus bigeumensis]